MPLLSHMLTNAKTAKSLKSGEYIGAILYMAPASLSGVNLCPAATNGCKEACLNTAGRGAMSTVQKARLRKAQYFNTNPSGFFVELCSELEKLEKKAAKQGKKAIVRLNGTSDIAWERIKTSGQIKNVFELFPNIQFYDYTKRFERLVYLKDNGYSNYHLTYSAHEANEKLCRKALKLGYNVATVFRNKLPLMYDGYPVYNGDNTDLRFIDPPNHVIGLIAKGKAKKDASGFVRD